jgi:hypothetical protein
MCDVLSEQLQPGNNRYTPYPPIVESDPTASYVFQLGSAQSAAFAKKITQQRLHYRLTVEDNYDIYQRSV